MKKNILFVCHTTHKDWLYSDSCLVKNINWLVDDQYTIPSDCTAKFRYRQPDQEVHLEFIDPTTVMVRYPQKISAITCGQEAVFYDGKICLGGGVIEEVYRDGNDLNQTIIHRYEESNHAN